MGDPVVYCWIYLYRVTCGSYVVSRDKPRQLVKCKQSLCMIQGKTCSPRNPTSLL